MQISKRELGRERHWKPQPKEQLKLHRGMHPLLERGGDNAAKEGRRGPLRHEDLRPHGKVNAPPPVNAESSRVGQANVPLGT